METRNHNILYTCITKQQYVQEFFWQDHSLTMILSGESHNIHNNENSIARIGNIGLIRKNQIFKSIKKNAPDGTPYESVCILFNEEILRKYSAENEIYSTTPYRGNQWIDLTNSDFLNGFFQSLLPYFKQPERLSKKRIDLKTVEAIELLLEHNPALKDFLFDFKEPFKINLEAFMLSHFTYNISMEKFAKLTGRSLSTFKRDFKKVFQATPERWLKEKRLNKAHFLLSEKNQKPSAVYFLVGFENFAHFSSSFKERFGFNASEV